MMNEISKPTKRIDYRHYVVYNDVKYIRTETLSLKHYCWENNPNEILDFHTIEWKLMNDKESPIIEYFSLQDGWSKNGILDKSNPIPEIENCFKETVGKNLIYFEYSK